MNPIRSTSYRYGQSYRFKIMTILRTDGGAGFFPALSDTNSFCNEIEALSDE